MRKPQAPRLARLVAIESFIEHNAERLPVTYATPAFARLRKEIVALRDSCAGEEELRLNRLAETQRYQALRKTLVEDHLAAIVAHAKMVGTNEAKQLKMPRGNPPADKFAGIARGLVGSAVDNHMEALVEVGLPPDFGPRCLELIDEMIASHTTRERFGFEKGGMSKHLAATLTSSRSPVTVLGISVRKESRRDPALLAAWRSIASPAQHAKLTSGAKAALPSPESAAALPAPTMKLLGPTPEPPPEESGENKSRPLGPLGRLFGS